MKALSIRQPWAHLIVSGLKDVECRTWETDFRGRVYIHAALKTATNTLLAYQYIKRLCPSLKMPMDVYYGGIIGEVDIIDCKFRSPGGLDYSEWHSLGMHGFILANPVAYEKPIPCKGQLGFFDVTEGETEFSTTFRDK